MPNVKMIQGVVTATGAHAPGEVVTVDERTAIEWLALGLAERADSDDVQCCSRAVPCKAVKKGATPR